MTFSLENYCIEKKNNSEKVLVAYVTAGLPKWVECIDSCIAAGADIIEVGLPFSDPIMDGPVIARASAKALESGSKTSDLLKQLEEKEFSVPLVVMTYSNVIYSHRVAEIVEDLARANIKGLIIPDIPLENRGIFLDEINKKGIAFIPLISSTTGEDRKAKIAESAQGFLYCVAIKGVTGQNEKIDIGFIKSLEKYSKLARYCGVGIRNEHDARDVISDCDGVIVGTAIVQKMLDSDDPVSGVAEVVSSIRKAIDN